MQNFLAMKIAHSYSNLFGYFKNTLFIQDKGLLILRSVDNIIETTFISVPIHVLLQELLLSY